MFLQERESLRDDDGAVRDRAGPRPRRCRRRFARRRGPSAETGAAVGDVVVDARAAGGPVGDVAAGAYAAGGGVRDVGGLGEQDCVFTSPAP
jgi:hypothetical protein